MKSWFTLFRHCRRTFCSQQIKVNPSTLFVPGRLAGDIYQISKPFIHPDVIAEELDSTNKSCELRGIKISCETLLEKVREWSALNETYRELLNSSHELAKLSKSAESTEKIEVANRELKSHIAKIAPVREKLHCIEDHLMPLLQRVPNKIHPSTPLSNDVIEIVYMPEATSMELKLDSHMVIAESMIEFNDSVSPTSCFMFGELAELESAIQNYFWEKLQAGGFTPLLGVDFCKSFILEAIGKDPYSLDESIIIQNKDIKSIGQKLHLVGGASLESMCAYFVNMNVGRKTLPMRYFALSRCYNAKNRVSPVKDLFSMVQSTNAHVLILCEQDSEENEFNSLCDSMTEFFKDFNLPFRIVDVSAPNLNLTESRRKQFELWSPSLRQFIHVGHVSQRGNFISRRLRITMGTEYKVEGHPSLVEGVVVNSSILIGCIVENNSRTDKTFDVPSSLKCFMPGEL